MTTEIDDTECEEETCDNCGALPDDHYICDACSTTLCAGDTWGRSGDTLCESCYDDACAEDEPDDDDELINIDHDQYEIYGYHQHEVSWQFHKQAWENTTYHGIELEMAFKETSTSAIFNYTNEYLKHKHLWMQDGSICERGAELITTPMTLQYARQNIKWREYLAKLSELGCRSYEPGTCGLHVHISHNAPYNRKRFIFGKIARFFIANRSRLFKFSQRSEESFEEFANIPHAYNEFCGKYCAVSEHSSTLEFRLYRGTLDYKRFWVSVQFSYAVYEFALSHGVSLCRSSRSWTTFLAFAKKNYPIVFKYLNEKGI